MVYPRRQRYRPVLLRFVRARYRRASSRRRLGSRSPDLDDAQGEYLSRRVLVGTGSKANPALLDGLPSLIKGVSQDFHLVGVEGSSKRVLYQYPKQGPPFPALER